MRIKADNETVEKCQVPPRAADRRRQSQGQIARGHTGSWGPQLQVTAMSSGQGGGMGGRCTGRKRGRWDVKWQRRGRVKKTQSLRVFHLRITQSTVKPPVLTAAREKCQL